MSKAMSVLSHLNVILCLMFAVFLTLDMFNPMMNFVDNGISRVLLGALCVIGTVLGALRRSVGEKKN